MRADNVRIEPNTDSAEGEMSISCCWRKRTRAGLVHNLIEGVERRSPKKKTSNESNDRSLLRELLAFDLRHPNIVRILAFTHMSNIVQVVYELIIFLLFFNTLHSLCRYVDGPSLAKMLLAERSGTRLLSFRRAAQCIQQVNRG